MVPRRYPFLKVISMTAMMFPLVSCMSNGEGDVINKVLQDYSTEERPVKTADMPVVILFGLKVNSFLALQMKNEVMDTILWILLTWKDERLSWNPKLYNGTESVSIPVHKLWMPDIVLYNSAEDTLSSSPSGVKTKVSVKSSGVCTLLAPLRYMSMCSVNVKNFPYDYQRCNMVFGSWTLDRTKLVIKKLGKNTTTYLSEQFSKNGQWHIKKVEVETEDKHYSGFGNPFSQLRVTFHFKRKPMYFLLYLILPCNLVSFLILLVFIIPASSGERLGLGITVILNMSVYLLVVSDKLPESSDDSPLLGVFFVAMLHEMTFAFLLSGITLWISSWQTDVPEILQKMLFICRKSHKPRSKRKIMVREENQGFEMEKEAKTDSRAIASRFNDQQNAKFEQKEELKDSAEKKTWEDVGRKLDKIFFILFFLLLSSTLFGIVFWRPET